jgi:PiT family inorganic phosphate transporter
MFNSTLALCIGVICTAVVFDFINGFHDTANSIATSVSTRVLTLKQAIFMSASLNLIGALISGGVAKTVGSDLVNKDHISQLVVLVALFSAIIWDLFTWYIAMPSSSTHALVGGLIGASIAYSGSFNVVYWNTFLYKIVLWLFLSTILGFIFGYIFMTLINHLFKNSKPSSVSKIFSKMQILSAGLMAFNHGMNDAQKSMGVITMALVIANLHTGTSIPLWVKILCASAMAAGTSIGGMKIIKTVGLKMAKLAPINGFAAESVAAGVIFTASTFNAPVSTTHIISTAIMGVGSTKRLSSVKWSLAKNIVTAWIFTIPACALISATLILILKAF